jgi:transketolase
MAEVQGPGYIGQALGVADILAVLYADQLRFRPEDPDWPERDRFHDAPSRNVGKCSEQR